MADYQADLLHSTDYKTTQWSGGTTTELCIAPEGSIYADRDFMWRLSSATVELEESDFTSLPDYDRIIMTLKGDISLSHNNDNWIDLPEFTPHSFAGADATVSKGKVTDFNLMLRKDKCAGLIVPLRMQQGEGCDVRSILTFDMPEYEAVMIYCYKGALSVTLETGREYRLESGDTLKLTGNFEGAQWSCSAGTTVAAVVSAVHCAEPVV